jgi:hypothetical protein
MNPPYPHPPLLDLVGRDVNFPPPKGAPPGTPPAHGTVIKVISEPPVYWEDWGWYWYYAQLIRWDDQTETIQITYRDCGLSNRRYWHYGGQNSIEDQPAVVKALCHKVLQDL